MELKLKNLTKTFGTISAVNNVSYTLHEGVYGLLGVNGAGKTTLIRILATLLPPTSGSITWDGADIFKMDGNYRRLLGYLPQDFGVYPDFSIEEYLLYIASLKGLRPATAKERSKALLKQVGLYGARGKRMKSLSGGMRRRAGIAQAMLNNPKLLILDEPTAGLDPNERIRFRNLLSRLGEDRIVLLSTHIVPDVEYIAGEILMMKEGCLAHTGTPEALIANSGVRVWRCVVPKAETPKYQSAFRVANIRAVSGGEELRILSQGCPCPGATLEEVNLEDVFLNCFGEKGGVEA